MHFSVLLLIQESFQICQFFTVACHLHPIGNQNENICNLISASHNHFMSRVRENYFLRLFYEGGNVHESFLKGDEFLTIVFMVNGLKINIFECGFFQCFTQQESEFYIIQQPI